MPPVPLVRFERVRKTYDGQHFVVRDLSLEVASGEFLTLLGPSGSGKTTTLMMLAGFAPPSAGDIFLEGRSIARLPPNRRGIGVVFQNYALFPHMTVAENVAFPLSIRRVKRAEQRRLVERALAMVRLPGLGDRRPAQLSGGQQQRVALARALVFEPPLVLLDEPLGALDRGLREEMQLELRRLHRELGITMIYVTHDQAEALTLSDRIAVFHDGAVQQVAAPETLYEDPANAFVAGFVGENNRLPGRVARIEDAEDGIAEIALDCGVSVMARLADARPGEICTVTIRPERIAVAAADPAGLGERALPATLQEAIYLGDHLRLRFALGREGEVVVKRPAASGGAGLAPGREAAIAWEPQHARAFKRESA